jgi:hypothetical protein
VIYSEQDIDFQTITDRRFEELCFDLLLRLGYKGLTWRQGGADGGRDIEGRFHVTNPLTESYDEKWFFECKRWTVGVPMKELVTKIAWADVERPKHLVIIASSHITNDTKIWLEKIAIQKNYAIHVIEGKRLKQLLLSYPDLIGDYFVDEYSKLLRDSQRNLLVHNLLPEPGTLYLLSAKLTPNKLTGEELAFLLSSVLLLDTDIESWCENNDYFNMDHIFANLQRHSNTATPLVDLIGDYAAKAWAFSNCAVVTAFCDPTVVTLFKDTFISLLLLNYKKEQRRALYIYVATSDTEAIELLMEVTGDFSTKIRNIKVQNTRDEIHKIMVALEGHKDPT